MNLGTKSKIFILGGDGFCGWPTALHLSARGHRVTILDNLSRRRIDAELGSSSLTPIRSIDERIKAWRELTGREIEFHHLDVALDYSGLVARLRTERPEAVVHFAEQRSAPYSMKSSTTKRYTVVNNLSATHNVLSAVVESNSDSHVVHLGSMGVYGYETAGMTIPEGYLRVKMDNGRGESVSQEILYPAKPDSIYHLTKAQDQLLFAFYNKNDGVRITDLHQGIVWGTQSLETRMDERLINRFDYDGDYGTVLNRFLMQAAIEYPLTVYGSGGQTRAFIHIQDTVRCIELAIVNAPARGERVRIFNQMSETHRIADLAKLIAKLTGAGIQYVPNLRNEAAENEFHVENACLLGYGLKPLTLADDLMREVHEIAEKYKYRCDRTKIPSTARWIAGSGAEA